MKRPSYTMTLAFVAFTALATSGCLRTDTLVTVKPDGSGTVEQTLLVNTATIEGFAALGGEPPSGGRDSGDGQGSFRMPSTKDMLDEAKLKQSATAFGPGVRFVSTTPAREGELEGARAVFAFDDINTLRVSEGQTGGNASQPSLTFSFEKRQTGGVLTVHLPDRADPTAAKASQSEKTPPVPPQILAMMKPLFADMRVGLTLAVDGSITKTTATHVSGSRITLVDVDFGALMTSPGAFEQLMKLGPGASMSEAAPVLQNLPGLKVQTTPTVTVEFQ